MAYLPPSPPWRAAEARTGHASMDASRASATDSAFDQARVARLIARSGCLVCATGEEAVGRAIRYLWIEGYSDWETRQRLAASSGMCRAHWWRTMTDPTSHAFGASNLLDGFVQDEARTLADIEAMSQRPQRLHSLRAAIQRLALALGRRCPLRLPAPLSPESAGQKECPLCETQMREEIAAIRRLVEALTDRALWERYEQSDGLCMSHLRLALAANPSEELARALIADMRRRLGVLLDDFAAFFHKADYRYHDEPRGDEQTAWLRAIERVAGPSPWRPPADFPDATEPTGVVGSRE